MPYIVEEMTAQEVMGTYRPAYKKNWTKAIRALLESPEEMEVISSLRAELRTNGGFEHPVRVSSKSGRVTDGMHRVTAAHLEGNAKLGVFKHAASPDNLQYLEVKFQCKQPIADTNQFFVFDNFRSFKTDTHWVSCEIMSSSGTGPKSTYRLTLAWPTEEAMELEKAFIERALKIGCTLKYLTVKPDELMNGAT